MSKGEQIKIAESAAPARISKDATIMVYGTDGKLMEAKKGSNGFTCIPSIEMRCRRSRTRYAWTPLPGSG